MDDLLLPASRPAKLRVERQAPVIVATAWKQTEASVIKSLLEGYSIPCHYSSELPHGIYPVSVDGLAEIRIFVPAPLAAYARRILAEHRRNHHAHLRLVDEEDESPHKV